MAYRQLCAVTFAVLGWVTVGCGSGGGGPDASPDAIDEHPPGNRDQPTNNAEQAPINPDQPPNEAGGLPNEGGDVESECRAFCDSVAGKDCTGGGKLNATIRSKCPSGCVLSAQDRLCANEIAGIVHCMSSLSGLCTDAFDEDQDSACDASFRALNACEEANDPDDDTQGACNTAGGCACDTACEACECIAGNNAEAKAACAAGICAP